jgi:DNA-binding transcriptional LysR family regulator
VSTLCNLARNGIGVGIVNPFSAADMSGIAELAVRPFRPAIMFRTFLMRPPHRPLTMLAEAFVATLEEARDEELSRFASWGARAKRGGSVRS